LLSNRIKLVAAVASLVMFISFMAAWATFVHALYYNPPVQQVMWIK